MQFAAFLGLWAIAAFVLFKATNVVLAKRRHYLKSQELGCKPAPMYTPGDPFGLYNLHLMLGALRKNWIPESMCERMAAASAREGRLVTTYYHRLFFQKAVITCEPKNIQAVLATQFKDFEFGPNINGNSAPLLGNGIFASDGKLWAHSRAMLRPQFTREQINDLDLEENHVQKMLKVLPVNSNGWTDLVDLQPLFFRLTMDTATEFLFGESVDSQLAAAYGNIVNGNRNAQSFSYAFDQAQFQLFRAAQFGENYRLAHTRDFLNNVREVHAFVDFYVKLALDRGLREKGPEADKLSSSNKKEKYIFLEAIAAETQDPAELRDQLINILLAGRDTTASLLSWVFLSLARHPDIFAKLRQAVLDDFGSYSSPRNITFTSLKNSTCLQNTLKEALRLYAVVPISQRRAAIDTSLPLGGGPDGQSPMFVPKGTEVLYSVHAMHKRKDLWGEDADKFRPERWEGRKYGWEYLPFNGGPRICIGQQFALTEAAYVVVRLLQKFDALEGVGTDATPHFKMTMTCSPADGVRLRLRQAKE